MCALKAEIVAKAVEGPITSMVTASILQLHPRCTVVVDEAAATKHLTATIAPTLQEFADLVEAEPDFSKETLEGILHGLIERQGLKMGKVAQPLRVALTGRTVSPGIYEVMALLGKDCTIQRIRAGVARALKN